MTANINLSPLLRKTLFIALAVVSFVALFPLTVRVVDPLFTYRFNPEGPFYILLVWQDHIEVRGVGAISEVSPRPKGETYTFNVPPERQAWVEEQVYKISDPDPESDVGFAIRIKQLGPDRQRIRLEAWGSASMRGLIYEAQPDRIVPLYTRANGVMINLVIVGGGNLVLWGILWFGVRLIWRLTARFRRPKRAPASSILTA